MGSSFEILARVDVDATIGFTPKTRKNPPLLGVLFCVFAPIANQKEI
jgi:hypothetical protein